ncbi:MAG: alpha-amylase family glycosyl hydrolase [Candidatus Zhuqueibacterota bacterium]
MRNLLLMLILTCVAIPRGVSQTHGPLSTSVYQTEDDARKGKFYNAKIPTAPGWTKNAVIYEMNTRQFSNEGTFAAIEPRVQELKDLGVTIMWFMPIHPIGEKNRKGALGSYYSVKDYYGINPEFGALEDFQRLVDLFHHAGIHVIIDLVANHTAWDNPLILDHPEWYRRDATGRIVAPVADWSDVADLNYDKPELWDYMIRMMEYWVRDIGIDGFRCDVAEMVPMEFWVKARTALDAIKPVFMLAEGESPELHASGFDMTYSFAMHKVFNDIPSGKKSIRAIDELFRLEAKNYPKGSMRMRFTSSHDENSWNRSEIVRMGRDGAKVGAVLSFTLPGHPLIYAGQEVGNERSLAFFERDPIEWKENEFRPLYQTLSRLYKNSPALYQGGMKKIASDNDDRIYAFLRYEESDSVLVVVNFSAGAFDGRLHVTGIDGEFNDIFSGESIHLTGGKISVKMAPWEYHVYTRAAHLKK